VAAGYWTQILSTSSSSIHFKRTQCRRFSKPTENEVEAILNTLFPISERVSFNEKFILIEPTQLVSIFNPKAFNEKIEEIELHFQKTPFSKTRHCLFEAAIYYINEEVKPLRIIFLIGLVTIPNVGHWLHVEKLKEFFRKNEFFKTLKTNYI
jgi:hypothetical protein